MDIKKTYDSLKNEIFELETKRSELQNKKNKFVRDNFDKMFVGKFWKNDNVNAITYSYCKKSGIEEDAFDDYCNYGIIDYFKIDNTKCASKFYKDHKEFLDNALYVFLKKK